MGIILAPTRRGDVEEVTDFIKPKFYRGREGPKYRVINFTREYEYREYQASTWIGVRVSGQPYGKAVKSGHSALLKYLNGKNGPEREMNETCPLRTQVPSMQELKEQGEFIVSLHLPWENQNNPPSPSDKELFIQDQPKHFAYVSIFDGVADELCWTKNIQNLVRVLREKGIEHNKNIFYTCRFDHALKIGKKHNEVILPVS